MKTETIGTLCRINGPVVVAEGISGVRLSDMMLVGSLSLLGEVVHLRENKAVIQVYEETAGLRVGDPVHCCGAPLQAELGPGLLGKVFDGLQRPLDLLAAMEGAIIPKGAGLLPCIDRNRAWLFQPLRQPGEDVQPGDVLGTLQESRAILHHVLVPPGVSGRLIAIESGELRVEHPVAEIRMANGAERSISMLQKWPARIPRPFRKKCSPEQPLITGQRVIDSFFPQAMGGVTIIPGGFGTGKTVLEQTLIRWAEADIVIFIGCGERGNEMAELLEQFPLLIDARTGLPLSERSILIANTSNMPVCAREASIYIGMTLAEYYRDMGYQVLLLADSTSRWSEALREVSGRLDELPGEEGYPAYLASRVAQFYERAGLVICNGSESRKGSVSVVGAISPPAGDFSEPVTQCSLRVAGTFWALDTDLARKRHFPAVNWINSYSLSLLDAWFSENVHPNWRSQIETARSLLQQEAELLAMVQLVGADALPEQEKLILAIGKMIREDYLQQSAYHPVDSGCSLQKQFGMLRVILHFYQFAAEALRSGWNTEKILQIPEASVIPLMKSWRHEEFEQRAAELEQRLQEKLHATTFQKTV